MHAAAQGSDPAREWTAKVKRGLDCDKCESADGFEALDIKLASAFKCVLSRTLNVHITQKERTLEQTTGKPLSGRQILCVIVDYFKVNQHDKDCKHMFDLIVFISEAMVFLVS